MIKVEFVIRSEKVPLWVRKVFEEYIVMEVQGDRLIADVPVDWVGFKDGTIVKILTELNEAVYVALAYMTDNEHEIVTDLEGNPVDRFEEIVCGRKYFKYVKKRLRILRVMSLEDEIFTVCAYVLNLEYPEPVVKILDVYSVGKMSGLPLSYFRREK